MDIKKFALVIIIAGFIIAGYGLIKYINAGKIVNDYGDDALGYGRRMAELDADDAKEQAGNSFIPYIVIGVVIAIVGLGVRAFTQNKP